MPAQDIVIVSAVRTAVGSFNGAFANTPAHELGAAAITAALARAHVEGGEVDEVILGQVLTAGQGQNPARQAAMAAGVPKEKTAWGLNQLCGSGLRAVALGLQQITNGDAAIIVAGGMESMTQAPHAAYLRAGQKMGELKMADTMLKDGLMDAFNGYHMGNTAENIAAKWQITREDQDRFATASQNKAEAAQKEGRFKDEIVPFTVKGRKGDTVVEDDEFIRPGTLLGERRSRSGRHGLRPDPGLPQGSRKSRLDRQGPRPRRSQRGFCGSGDGGEQGHGLGPLHRECERRGDRHRAPDRRLRGQGADHAAA